MKEKLFKRGKASIFGACAVGGPCMWTDFALVALYSLASCCLPSSRLDPPMRVLEAQSVKDICP